MRPDRPYKRQHSHENRGYIQDENEPAPYIQQPQRDQKVPTVELAPGKFLPNTFEAELENEEPERETFGNPIEFIFSCVSMSVGLGNVWRFPATAAKNGGGAFLIPYLIVLLLIGRPLYYLEMCLGQFSKFGPVKVWNMSPLFKGVGYGSVFSVICVLSYYCSLMAITVYYFVASFSTELPWSVCNEEKFNCTEIGEESYAHHYFHKEVFPSLPNIDDGLGSLHWKLALCLVGSWTLVFLSLVNGVKSSGKVAYFTAIFPYVVLSILLVRGLTLEGAWSGILYFITPRWSALLSPKVWYAAVEQCLFSLGTGAGTIIYLSSHNKFKQNLFRDALIISFTDTFTSLLAGCTIFSVMGNLVATSKNLTFEHIEGGSSLAFILYPQAIAQFDWAPQFFSVLFFLMLFTLGVGSTTPLAGNVITIICDQFTTWKRWLVTLVVCVGGCLLGLVYVTEGGPFMLDLVDHYGVGLIIYVMAMLECFAISYVYGLSNWCNDIEFMLGRKVGIYWKVCWAFIVPVGLLANLLYYLITEPEFMAGNVPYPKLVTVFGWLLTAFAVALVPAWGLHTVVTRKAATFKEKFTISFQPTEEWGPQQPTLRREWLLFRAEKDAEQSKTKCLVL
ncbi:unnamed protein product [Orchesella dallaii]|uniref:Sodium-dependent nutrient amino acid transporter 1 n=1 Tax=Orchesella dallaii TaxID=48710 RepID=A0ABP1RIC9_9HEXA